MPDQRETEGRELEPGPQGHEVVFRAAPIHKVTTMLPRQMTYPDTAFQLPEGGGWKVHRTTRLYRDRYDFPDTQLYLGIAIDSSGPGDALDVYEVLHGEHPLILDATAAPQPVPSKLYFEGETIDPVTRRSLGSSAIYSIAPDGTIQEVVTESRVKPEEIGQIFTPGKLNDPSGFLAIYRGGTVNLPIKIGGMTITPDIRIGNIWIQTPIPLEDADGRPEAAIPVPEATPVSFFNPPVSPEQAGRRVNII